MSEAATDARPTAKTILVVDDEKNIRRTLQLVLEGEGYRVIGAESDVSDWRSNSDWATWSRL